MKILSLFIWYSLKYLDETQKIFITNNSCLTVFQHSLQYHIISTADSSSLNNIHHYYDTVDPDSNENSSECHLHISANNEARISNQNFYQRWIPLSNTAIDSDLEITTFLLILSHRVTHSACSIIVEDENDALYLFSFDKMSDSWVHLPDVELTEVRKDLVVFSMPKPLYRWMVLNFSCDLHHICNLIYKPLDPLDSWTEIIWNYLENAPLMMWLYVFVNEVMWIDRFLVLRCRTELPVAEARKLVYQLEEQLTMRAVRFILFQKQVANPASGFLFSSSNPLLVFCFSQIAIFPSSS